MASKKCGARTKRRGTPCEAPAMSNGRCRIHGGCTPSGIVSPHFKHGRYSRYGKYFTEAGLLELAERALNSDPLDSEDDLALLQTRILQLLEHGNSVSHYRDLAAAWKRFNSATDETARREAEAELDELIAGADRERKAWAEIYKLTRHLDLMRSRYVQRGMVARIYVKVDVAISMLTSMGNAFLSVALHTPQQAGRPDLYEVFRRAVGREFERIVSKTEEVGQLYPDADESSKLLN